MRSIVDRALTISRKRDARLRGVEVRYVPLDGSPGYTVTMSPASPRTEEISEGGIAVSRRIDDWICEVADLKGVPQRGDIIEHEGLTYKVSHPGGSRHYDFHDSYHRSYRIHTTVQPSRTVQAAGYANKDGVAYTNKDGTTYAKPGS